MITPADKASASAKPDRAKAVEEKIQQFRELFADAPELGKKPGLDLSELGVI